MITIQQIDLIFREVEEEARTRKLEAQPKTLKGFTDQITALAKMDGKIEVLKRLIKMAGENGKA